MGPIFSEIMGKNTEEEYMQYDQMDNMGKNVYDLVDKLLSENQLYSGRRSTKLNYIFDIEENAIALKEYVEKLEYKEEVFSKLINTLTKLIDVTTHLDRLLSRILP